MGAFVASLRNIAEHCDYSDSLKDILQDRIICGLQDKSVQCSLLKESRLTYDAALDAKMANRDSQQLQDRGKPEGPPPGEVHKVSGKDTYR